MPIVFLATYHQLYEKIISNMQEVKSRNKYPGYCYRRRQTSQGDSRFCDRSTADPQCFGTSSQRRSPADTCVLCGSR